MTSSNTASDVIVSIGRDPYRTEVQAGRHGVIADEPASAGGADAGPSPYQLLLAALGACKAITLRMYADRKGWSLDQVACALRHRRDHADDSDHCEEEGRLIDAIDVELQLVGDLTEPQRQRLLEIADRCPVHRTLSARSRIRSTLVAGA